MKEKIIDLIQQGGIEEAFKLALNYFNQNNPKAHERISLLFYQFNDLKQNKLLGLGEAPEQRNRVVTAFLEIMNGSDKLGQLPEKNTGELQFQVNLERDRQSRAILDELYRFCKSLEGHWISQGSDEGLLGFVTFRTNKAGITVQKKGQAFDSDGEEIYRWNSIASSIDLENEKLDYIWEGNVFEKPPGSSVRRAKEPKNKGWGEISFKNKKNGKFSYAIGQFYDTELQSSSKLKTSRFERCDPDDMEVIHSGITPKIAELVNSILNQ